MSIGIASVKENISGGGYELTLADGRKLGVPKAIDNRYYIAIQNWVADGNVITPKDEWESTLEIAQARRIREIKREARGIMSENTDWYVIRKAETGGAIPGPIQIYRASIRQATNDAETAINALTSIAIVRDYQPVWPILPGE